jgi:hypothetical protein
MTEEQPSEARPWSTRRPQNLILSAVLLLVAAALVWQGFAYIGQGQGGLVPYFIILGGPVLACYYVWYFVFRRFDDDGT